MKFPHWPFALLTGCILVIGCGPAPQPVWNKDSRSFFYTQSDGSVSQYDLDKQACRTLLAAGDRQPRQVALSPTLPFLAVANSAMGPKGRATQVGLVSLLTGGTIWGDLEIWGDQKARRDICAASCEWSPDGKRILIWYQGGDAEHPLGRFAVFDAHSRNLSELTTAPPAMILAQALHVSPLCPDGSGYLAMKLPDSGPQFFFVSWDGWEYPLDIASEVTAQFKLLADQQAPSADKLSMVFPLPQGVWSDQVLKFPTQKGLICIDLKQRKITLAPLTESQRQEFVQIRAADTADAPWTTVQVAPFRGEQFALHCRQKMKDGRLPARIELVDQKVQRRRVILEGLLSENLLVHHLFPSPDGQLILVCLRDESGKTSWIHVVQPDGKILAKVDAGAVSVKGGP